MQRSELVLAIQSGDLEKVRLAIQRGCPLELVDDNGLTPLHHAASCPNPMITSLLLNKGVQPNPENRTLRTPLHIASETDNADTVQILLAGGAVVNATDSYSWTPLHDAASTDSRDASQVLLEAGANPCKLAKDGLLPHDVARQRGFDALADILFSACNKKLCERPLPSLPPVSADSVPSGFTDYNDDKIPPEEKLIDAIEKGNVATVGHLLEKEFIYVEDETFGSSIFTAVEKGNADIVRLLVNAGAQVNFVGNYGEMPLHIAARHGNCDTIRILIKAGADWKATGPSVTAMHYAAEAGQAEAVRTLFECGASLHGEPCKYGPIHIAAEYNKVNVLAVLVELGADVNDLAAMDYPMGRTPLEWASNNASLEAMAFLVDHGADINGRPKGCGPKPTPLHIAVQYNQPNAVFWLVEHGADLTLKNVNGKTPLDLINPKEMPDEVEAYLKQHLDMGCHSRKKVPPVPRRGQAPPVPPRPKPRSPIKPPLQSKAEEKKPFKVLPPPARSAEMAQDLNLQPNPAVFGGQREINTGHVGVDAGSVTYELGESGRVSLQGVAFGKVISSSHHELKVNIRVFLFDNATHKSQLKDLEQCEKTTGRVKIDAEVFPKLNILLDQPLSMYVTPATPHWSMAPNRKKRTCRQFCDIDDISSLPVAADLTFQYMGPVNETPSVFSTEIRLGFPVLMSGSSSQMSIHDEYLQIHVDCKETIMQKPTLCKIKQRGTRENPDEDRLVAGYRKLSLEHQTPMVQGYENMELSSKPYDPRERIIANLASYTPERRDKLLVLIRKELDQKPMNDISRKRMHEAFDADIHTLVAYLMEELFDTQR